MSKKDKKEKVQRQRYHVVSGDFNSSSAQKEAEDEIFKMLKEDSLKRKPDEGISDEEFDKVVSSIVEEVITTTPSPVKEPSNVVDEYDVSPNAIHGEEEEDDTYAVGYSPFMLVEIHHMSHLLLNDSTIPNGIIRLDTLNSIGLEGNYTKKEYEKYLFVLMNLYLLTKSPDCFITYKEFIDRFGCGGDSVKILENMYPIIIDNIDEKFVIIHFIDKAEVKKEIGYIAEYLANNDTIDGYKMILQMHLDILGRSFWNMYDYAFLNTTSKDLLKVIYNEFVTLASDSPIDDYIEASEKNGIQYVERPINTILTTVKEFFVCEPLIQHEEEFKLRYSDIKQTVSEVPASTKEEIHTPKNILESIKQAEEDTDELDDDDDQDDGNEAMKPEDYVPSSSSSDDYEEVEDADDIELAPFTPIRRQ